MLRIHSPRSCAIEPHRFGDADAPGTSVTGHSGGGAHAEADAEVVLRLAPCGGVEARDLLALALRYFIAEAAAN